MKPAVNGPRVIVSAGGTRVVSRADITRKDCCRQCQHFIHSSRLLCNLGLLTAYFLGPHIRSTTLIW
jgi:hypothetical protein